MNETVDVTVTLNRKQAELVVEIAKTYGITVNRAIAESVKYHKMYLDALVQKKKMHPRVPQLEEFKELITDDVFAPDEDTISANPDKRD